MEAAAERIFARHWRLWVALAWVGAAAFLMHDRWNAIGWFALGDTDDNLRMMQVRALLAGQDWFDLRQYRLDPPGGADIHWSRIVDLPIAGLMLFFRLFTTGAMAEKIAVAVAPLLPMAIAMGAVALTCRRLIAPSAFVFAIAFLLCAHSARGMWTPLRIDHHGWQLAMLALVVAGLADPKLARGGLVVGLATAVSLAIGLEMLVYLALAGAAVGLMWIRDGAEARRLASYGASLAGACALLYLAFTSYANRQPVCDALSPVWLSAMTGAGALAVLLAFLPQRGAGTRLLIALIGGAVIAGAFALTWPHCLGRLEGVSPELDRLWLSNVREARPIYTHSWETIIRTATLPLIGLVGYGVMLWRLRRDAERLTRWAALAALGLTSAALLLWQTRAGAAAQLLAVPGVTALAWAALPQIRQMGGIGPQIVAAAGAFALLSGIGPQEISRWAMQAPAAPRSPVINQANARCPTMAALRPVALQPKGYVLTFVDLGPRLIAVTHHDAVAGPYHRNQAAILDVGRTFRRSAEHAREVVSRRGIDYVLICPNMSESTVFRSSAPNGFYVQLARGQVPNWLTPVPLPKGSPYRMWRVLKR